MVRFNPSRISFSLSAVVLLAEKLQMQVQRVNMCAICGCGIDAGNADTMFVKDYKCLDCGQYLQSIRSYQDMPVMQLQEIKACNYIDRCILN